MGGEAARGQWGLNGVLFRTPLWSAQELLRLKPVFDLLAEAGRLDPARAAQPFLAGRTL